MRIRFIAEADLVITDAQGLDCMEELEILTDWDIKNLCKVIRRPSGINPITNIANLVMKVSLRDEKNLKLAIFFLKHKLRTGRVVVATDMTLDSVRILRDPKDNEKEHKDTVVSPMIDANNWPKTMEILEEYLMGILELKVYRFLMW